MAYRTGNSEDKLKLQEKYDYHIEQKKLFRQKRTECKELAKQSRDSIQCATFDLQQVISLPRTKVRFSIKDVCPPIILPSTI